MRVAINACKLNFKMQITNIAFLLAALAASSQAVLLYQDAEEPAQEIAEVELPVVVEVSSEDVAVEEQEAAP